jgi:predicted SAM-dependent methyltransferase
MRLDLGAGFGAKTPAGFVAVDLYKAPGVRVVDLRVRWPWKANSVDEVHCDYVLQYLTAPERVHFANELDRVLKPGAQAKIIVPHPFAHRAYTDIRWRKAGS